MKIPYYKQETDWYCGPAVMQMVLASQKIKLSQKELAKKLKTTRRSGTDNEQIISLLKEKKFKYTLSRSSDPSASLKKLKNHLARKEIGVVTYWHDVDNYGHFAIVRKIGQKEIELQDPDREMYIIPIKKFLEIWHDSEGNKGWFLAIKPKL